MHTLAVKIDNIDKRKRQIRATHFMAALLCLVFGIRGLIPNVNSSAQLYIGSFGFLIAFGVAVFAPAYCYDSKKNQMLRIIEAVIILMGAVHFYQFKLMLPAISFLLTSLLLLFLITQENQILGGCCIELSEKGVARILGTRRKQNSWSDVEKIMIRGSVLTVEMKSNLYMQVELIEEPTAHFRAVVLDYAEACLAASNQK